MSGGPEKRLIVACDGGGIRGLISAMLLADLGQDLIDRVSLFAGTSTGAVISLALANGTKIDDVVAFYRDVDVCNQSFVPSKVPAEITLPGAEVLEAIEIIGAILSAGSFPSGAASLIELRAALERLLLEQMWVAGGRRMNKPVRVPLTGKFATLPGILYPALSNQGRKSSFASLLKPNRRIGRLKRLALATGFLLNRGRGARRRWQPRFMTNLPGFKDYLATTILDAAMCSTSAAGAYESYRLANGQRYADGGIYANNPGAVAMAAVQRSGALGSVSGIYLLSLGTGFVANSYPMREGLAKRFPWGSLGWNWPLANDTVERIPVGAAQTEASMQKDHMVCQLTLGPDRYRRANVDMGASGIGFSDCSAIPDLERLTRRYMKTKAWQRVRDWALRNFG